MSYQPSSPPAISIITPVYNARATLGRMLESVLRQSLQNIEHILIDDGSSDGSGQMLDEYARRHRQRRIVVIHQPNSGVPAYNPGLERAGGEYVAFLDHDDYLADNFCELLYARAVAEDADICKGEHVKLRGQARGAPSRSNDRIRKMGSRLGFYNFFWSAIYRRRLLEEHHLRFSERIVLGQDTLFQNEALLACRHLALVDEAYYYWCIHPESISEAQTGFSAVKLHSLIEASVQVAHNVCRGAGSDDHGMVYVLFRLITGLHHYATRAQHPQDAQSCLHCAGELLELCPARQRKSLVYNLQHNLPPPVVQQLLRTAAGGAGDPASGPAARVRPAAPAAAAPDTLAALLARSCALLGLPQAAERDPAAQTAALAQRLRRLYRAQNRLDPEVLAQLGADCLQAPGTGTAAGQLQAAARALLQLRP